MSAMSFTRCWCVLAICFAAVSGGGSGSDERQPQNNRHRRAADVFLTIVGEKPNDGSKNLQSPVSPVQIKLGGRDGVTLPVLIVPVYNGQGQSGSSLSLPPPFVASRGGPSESAGQQPEQYNQPSTNEINANPAPAIRQQINLPPDYSVGSVPVQESVPFSRDVIQAFDTSEEMVQSFIRETPAAPELSAVVLGAFPTRLPGAGPDSELGAPATPPPVPRFTRSLQLHTELTVPRADYTETFKTAWHADSQTTRTIVEDGNTVFYKAPLPDGRVQFFEVREDRSSGSEVRRCTLSPLMQDSSPAQGFPSLPDMTEFQFTGYVSAEGKSNVERWQRTVFPGVGKGGAVAGEAHTISHEMLVTRDNAEPMPLRYTVVIDSSVLGPAAEGYVARYRPEGAPTGELRPDTRGCSALERPPEPAAAADADALAEVAARFDPLREFNMPTRDPRYDTLFRKYKLEFKRNYLDETEEALRKTILVKSIRFVAASNRLTSDFELGTNFLADRLGDELKLLRGVEEPSSGASEAGMLPFPHSEGETKDIAGALPDEFDWRPRGAVSPIRFQGLTCMSCWAFAVAGATEGALFKKTSVLVPLSPQCLVDCGHPYGTHGCNGTWPSFAYDYVQARGLPAWDEYTNYQGKVLQCKDHIVPPVTHISGHVNVTANNVDALKVAIRNNGPTIVILDAEAKSFLFYKTGVLKDRRCGLNRRPLNHAVLAVGWGRQGGDHFIIKNSYSEKWGDRGYIRIDPGVCAMLQRPSYPLITQPDIDRQELRAKYREDYD